MTVGIFFLGLFLILNRDTFLVLPEDFDDEVAEVETVQPRYVDAKQLKCLATNIFYEAGSEPEAGKAAVARVVMNRVKAGFGPNPCTVIYQVITVLRPSKTETEYYIEPERKVKVCQFSWVCENDRKPLNVNDPNYKQSERIAYRVLAYDDYRTLLPNTVLFFHNLWVHPMWPYKKVAQIGNHIFYEKPKKQPKAAPLLTAKAD